MEGTWAFAEIYAHSVLACPTLVHMDLYPKQMTVEDWAKDADLKEVIWLYLNRGLDTLKAQQVWVFLTTDCAFRTHGLQGGHDMAWQVHDQDIKHHKQQYNCKIKCTELDAWWYGDGSPEGFKGRYRLQIGGKTLCMRFLRNKITCLSTGYVLERTWIKVKMLVKCESCISICYFQLLGLRKILRRIVQADQ